MFLGVIALGGLAGVCFTVATAIFTGDPLLAAFAYVIGGSLGSAVALFWAAFTSSVRFSKATKHYNTDLTAAKW